MKRSVANAFDEAVTVSCQRVHTSVNIVDNNYSVVVFTIFVKNVRINVFTTFRTDRDEN